MQPNDIVNVSFIHPDTQQLQHVRARVRELQADGLLVEIDGERALVKVDSTQITRRLKLPWNLLIYTFFYCFQT